MTPNEIYALDDLDEKPWYAFEKSKHILVEIFPIDFDRAKADGNNRFSLCLKIRTPISLDMCSVCWALMFDGQPFGFFTAYMYLKDRSFDANVEIFDARVYITDLTLRQAAEDLVCSYVSKPILNKPIFNLPVVASDQALVFQSGFPFPALVDGIALMVPTHHRTQDGIVAFNASIYHRLLNELIEQEGEEKLKKMDWDDDSPIVKEMARIILLSIPKPIEARVGVGMIKKLYGGWWLALAVLRFDNGTHGLIIPKGACFHNYRNSSNIRLLRLNDPDAFGSAHERIKWMDEDPRRV